MNGVDVTPGMHWWEAFRGLPHADELLVAAGALLTLIAVMRIARRGLSLFLWVLLAGAGLGVMAHGSGRAPWQPPALRGANLSELLGDGGRVSRDALGLLCERLERLRGD